MAIELQITNETLYPTRLPGLKPYLASGQSIKIASEAWDKLKTNQEIEKLLANKEISVSSGHLLSLEGLNLGEVERAISACDDQQTLRRWFLDSKTDQSDWGKFVRHHAGQRIATLGHFKWQSGDWDGLADECYWRPSDVGKVDRVAEYKAAQDAIWEHQVKLEAIRRQARQYEQNLLKSEGLI